MTDLIRYKLKLFIKSNKLVAPVVLWVIFLFVNNSVSPIHFIDNVCTSGGILCFLMIWISFVYMDLEDVVSEQLLILKVRSLLQYNLSRIILLILIGAGMSILGVMIPLLQHLRYGCSLFTRTITVADLICTFILLFVMAFLGSMIGAITHPRIIKNRKSSMIIITLITIVGCVKGPITKDFPAAKYFLWAFPPLYNILKKYANLEYFTVANMINALILGIGYGGVLLVIYLFLLRKNKY